MEIHIHIHHHNHGDEQTVSQLNSINQKLEIMATKQERFDAILARIDAVTTNIAEDYKTLLQEVKDGTVSDESLAKAEANITTLETLAASKENPIPNEPPIPPADEQTV